MKIYYVPFILYRVIEKFFNLRCENYIGYFLFFLYSLILPKNTNKKYYISDKRSLWGKLRLDDISDLDVKKVLRKIKSMHLNGPIVYENTMESSIRAINIILYLKNKKICIRDSLLLNSYLIICYIHALICPDLYITRKSFYFLDQSNNHRFYNLIFFEFFKLHFFKKTSAVELESFIYERLVDDNFYNEGSSFYHSGVILSLITLREHFNSYSIFTTKFNNFIDRNMILLTALDLINFGDRDDTYIGSKKNYNRIHELYFNNNFFFIKTKQTNISNFLFIRKDNRTGFGTDGHVHDDFGHFTYLNYNGEGVIDPGIFLYDDEPKYCKANYHNFPFCENMNHMKFRARFHRYPSSNISIHETHEYISLTKSTADFMLSRILNKDSLSLVDYIIAKNDLEFCCEWCFYINFNSFDISTQYSNNFVLNNFAKFKFYNDCSLKIIDSLFYPSYGTSKSCKKLIVTFNKRIKNKTKFKLLEFATL